MKGWWREDGKRRIIYFYLNSNSVNISKGEMLTSESISFNVTVSNVMSHFRRNKGHHIKKSAHGDNTYIANEGFSQ